MAVEHGSAVFRGARTVRVPRVRQRERRSSRTSPACGRTTSSRGRGRGGAADRRRRPRRRGRTSDDRGRTAESPGVSGADQGTGDTPGGFCLGTGMPGSMLGSGGYPMEIIQRPNQITIVYEAHNEVRRVYLGDRIVPGGGSPAGPERSFDRPVGRRHARRRNDATWSSRPINATPTATRRASSSAIG